MGASLLSVAGQAAVIGYAAVLTLVLTLILCLAKQIALNSSGRNWTVNVSKNKGARQAKP
jgi:hypothetical protein